MQKLTLIEDISPEELVRYYLPESDDEDIDYILWEHTIWPYGPMSKINDGVYDYYLKNKR